MTPVTRHETFLAAAAQGDNSLTPITREEHFLNDIAEAVGSGGGGESNAVKYVSQSLTSDQKAQARTNIGAGTANAPTVETVTGATPSIAAEANHIYKCGELTSLTISTFPAEGEFTVVFSSGSTPTTFTEPEGMVMPSGFTIEANTRYEINVVDGYAVAFGWPIEVEEAAE